MESAIGNMGRTLHTLIRDLHRRRGRERRGQALAEGVRLVEEALAAEVPIPAALASPALEGTARGRSLKAALLARGVALTETTDADLAGVAATEHPQGIVAVVRPRPASLAELTVSARSVLVVLDAIQDPGNVGTIVRTAFALGASGGLALPGTVELANPKALRASMGALFRFPVVPVDDRAAAAWLAERGIAVVAAGLEGDPFDPVRLPRPLAIVLGNEGAGIRSPLGAAAPYRVTIPLVPGAESLNVAVTAGILLYGVTRD